MDAIILMNGEQGVIVERTDTHTDVKHGSRRSNGTRVSRRNSGAGANKQSSMGPTGIGVGPENSVIQARNDTLGTLLILSRNSTRLTVETEVRVWIVYACLRECVHVYCARACEWVCVCQEHTLAISELIVLRA